MEKKTLVIVSYWKNYELLNQGAQLFDSYEEADKYCTDYNNEYYNPVSKHTAKAIIVPLNGNVYELVRNDEGEVYSYNHRY